MSILKDAFTTIITDFRLCADKSANSILHSELDAMGMATQKGKFHAVGFCINLVDAVANWINDNPDADTVPASFLNPITPGDSAPEADAAPEVHTVSIDPSEGQ